MDLDWVRRALFDRRIKVIAERTGLSVPTVRAIRDGKGNPTLASIETVAAYLKGEKA